jgi:RimJ/RimL family protein N-acetyltransferase
MAIELSDDSGVRIIPATALSLRAEDDGGDALARALGIVTPRQWPPEFGGPPYRQALLDRMTQDPELGAYGGYYIVAGGRPVGICGFKGPPDASGEVEIGYSVAAPYQRRRYAKAAVDLLLATAFADPRVAAVIATTLPERTASIRVLERCGFAPESTSGTVLRFVKRRPTPALLGNSRVNRAGNLGELRA